MQALAGLETYGVDEGNFAAGLDLAVSLGGDGSMLRAVELGLARRRRPCSASTSGQLGYLTEIEPAGLLDAVKRRFTATHQVEDACCSRCGSITISDAADPADARLERRGDRQGADRSHGPHRGGDRRRSRSRPTPPMR